MTSILILRRPDLHHSRRDIPFREVALTDFRQTRDALCQASDIVFIEGIRQKVLKATYSLSDGFSTYMASSFSPTRHSVKVTDGVLVCEFEDDERMDVKAGKLICQPWTEVDNLAAHPEDDVLGATVSRADDSGKFIMFHDRGVYIPRPTYDDKV